MNAPTGLAPPEQEDVTERVPFARPEISREAQRAAARVLASGWVTTGPEVFDFEREFAAKQGASHAVAVASCTAAIEISLRALGLPPGARVLTSTMTFCGAAPSSVDAGTDSPDSTALPCSSHGNHAWRVR